MPTSPSTSPTIWPLERSHSQGSAESKPPQSCREKRGGNQHYQAPLAPEGSAVPTMAAKLQIPATPQQHDRQSQEWVVKHPQRGYQGQPGATGSQKTEQSR